jgi:putative transposon-encoded protein
MIKDVNFQNHLFRPHILKLNQTFLNFEISNRYLMKKVPQIPATELKVNNICGFYIRTVKPFGTSAKVDCPKEHLGKTVYLVILDYEE